MTLQFNWNNNEKYGVDSVNKFPEKSILRRKLFIEINRQRGN